MNEINRQIDLEKNELKETFRRERDSFFIGKIDLGEKRREEKYRKRYVFMRVGTGAR